VAVVGDAGVRAEDMLDLWIVPVVGGDTRHTAMGDGGREAEALAHFHVAQFVERSHCKGATVPGDRADQVARLVDRLQRVLERGALSRRGPQVQVNDTRHGEDLERVSKDTADRHRARAAHGQSLAHTTPAPHHCSGTPPDSRDARRRPPPRSRLPSRCHSAPAARERASRGSTLPNGGF
jgi:hypothetical protein